MKKILACVLAAAIASTAIIFSVSATTEETVIQNFDGTSATITEVTGSTTTLVNVANPDKSSQLVVRDAGHSWFHQAVPADAQDWSGMTGLSFYVDASRASQGLQYLDLQFYDANGGSARIVNEGAVGYLVLDDGTKMDATFNTYRLFNFPANFKGTIEIPLTSIAASVDLSKITTIEAAFGTATGDVYYFDDFRLYKEENGKVITKTIENFDAATAPISCSSCVSSLVVDTPADKALQAVTKFGGHAYFHIPVPAEKKDWSKADALVFYVELPDRGDIYMDIAFNDNDSYHRLAEGSAVAWFISEDGTVTDANFGGSYRMWTLPANFKGEFVIPLTSIDSAIDLTQMTNIEVAFGVAADETYIFDDFRLVTSTGDKNIIADYNDIAPSVPKASTAGVNDAISVWDGNGYKITAAGAGHTYFTLPVPEAAKDWTGKTSVSFYVDGSANGIQYFDIAFIDAANGKAGIVNEGAVGYLTPDGGEKTSASFNTYRMHNFPENFKGTVEVSLDSIAAGVDLSQVAAIEIAFGTALGDVLVFDNFALIAESAGGDTPPEGGDTPPEGGDTPPEGGDTPPEGGDTPPEGGDTPPEDDTPSVFPHDPTIGDFNDLTEVPAGSLWQLNEGDVSLSLQDNGENGKSLKIDVSANAQGEVAAIFLTPDLADWSAATGFTFFMDNSQNGEMTIDIAFKDADGSYHRLLSSGCVAYLIPADGSGLTRAFFNTYRMSIPAGFKGTVKIPMTSIDLANGEAIDLKNMAQIEMVILPKYTAGNTYVMDDFVLYLDESAGDDDDDDDNTPSDPFMLQDFEVEYAADAFSRWPDGAMTTFDIQDSNLAPNSTKGGKVSFGAPNGSQMGSVSYILFNNRDWSGTTGIRFWAENTDDERPVDIDFFFTEDNNPDTNIAERWVTKVGRAKAVFFNADTETYENVQFNSRMRIPAGFRGWIELPFTSFEVFIALGDDGVMDLTEITELAFGSDHQSGEGTVLFMDEVQLYNESLTDTWVEAGQEGDDGSDGDDNQGGTGDDNNTAPDTRDISLAIPAMLVLTAAAALVIGKKRARR